MGQFHPASLGALLAGRRNDRDRQLHQVRMYRGMPEAAMEKKAHSAARRQVSSWIRDPLVSATTRPLRYPRNYPTVRAQEKGIDVQLALDFAMMAVRGEYDIGILMSGDTDLHPALEEVMRLGGLYAKSKKSNGCPHSGSAPRLAGAGGFFTVRCYPRHLRTPGCPYCPFSMVIAYGTQKCVKSRLGGKTVEVATWEPLPGRRRFRVRLAGLSANLQPYCHWIGHSDYQTIQDSTNYA